MDLEKLINDDIKAAMLSKDREKLEALRAVKAAILLEKTKEAGSGEMTEEASLKILQKLVKQRKDSAQIYQSQNREDLANVELFQLSVIEKYLPAQMSEEDIRAIVKRIINETGASTVKDMGKVMGTASKELAGKADNSTIAAIVRQLLG